MQLVETIAAPAKSAFPNNANVLRVKIELRGRRLDARKESGVGREERGKKVEGVKRYVRGKVIING